MIHAIIAFAVVMLVIYSLVVTSRMIKLEKELAALKTQKYRDMMARIKDKKSYNEFKKHPRRFKQALRDFDIDTDLIDDLFEALEDFSQYLLIADMMIDDYDPSVTEPTDSRSLLLEAVENEEVSESFKEMITESTVYNNSVHNGDNNFSDSDSRDTISYSNNSASTSLFGYRESSDDSVTRSSGFDSGSSYSSGSSSYDSGSSSDFGGGGGSDD